MSRRRQYEPGGGVESLDWQTGPVPESEQWGAVLVEEWRTEVVSYDPRITRWTARLRAWRWNRSDAAWVDGTETLQDPGPWFVRRWARLRTVSTGVRVRVFEESAA